MWRFAAARATGRSHSRSGLPCQDRFACAVLADGTLIAAVADGAGSAPMGEVGAEIAVTTVLTKLQQGLPDQLDELGALLEGAARQARQTILSTAHERDLPARTFASTLLALVLGPDRGAALQIGDGVIALREDGDQWSWMFWPQRGEYANTTFFLTDEDAEARLQVETFSLQISDAALLTDGLEPLALHYETQSVYDPFFTGMISPLLEDHGTDEIVRLSSALQAFLESERVGSRTDDDVSLVLATRQRRDEQA